MRVCGRQARGVPVHRLVHYEGSFVLTFPNAYHAGFNTGAPALAPILATTTWPSISAYTGASGH